MKQKSCKLFINIVFFVSLLITIFSGNKVMGAPEVSEQIKSINFDSEYNYYNANSCGNNYNRELIKDSKSANAVYGCVTNKDSDDGTATTTMVCSSGSPVKQGSDNGPVWVCVNSKNSISNPSGNNTTDSRVATQPSDGSNGDIADVQNGVWKAVCYYNDVNKSLQIRFNDNDMSINAPTYLYQLDSSGNSISYQVKEMSIPLNLLQTAYDFNASGCPNSVFLSTGGKLTINKEGSAKATFNLIESISVSKKTIGNDSGEGNGSSGSGSSGNIVVTPPEINDCGSLLGSPSDEGSPSYYIVVSFKIVRYVAIILLIVLSVMDMVSAVASSDSEIIQKTVAKIIKRLILCVIIFLLPLLINFILQFIDSNLKVCGVGE